MTETKSEDLFHAFCDTNGLACERMPVSNEPTPDFLVTFPSGQHAYFEIKQIEEASGFRGRNGVSSRTVGEHIRARIADARAQIRYGASKGVPSVLLIYNNVDPYQRFGTEQHDFLAALYGEMTVTLRAGKIIDSFHGRNSTVREGHNTSFSAVGHLQSTSDGCAMLIYENVFARNRLQIEAIPKCIEYRCVEVLRGAA